MASTTANGNDSRLFRLTTTGEKVDLGNFLREELLPKLKPEDVLTHPDHHWQEQSASKWKGGCPWHKSKTGSAFYVDIDQSGFLWYCPSCKVGGNAITYAWMVARGAKAGSPLGQDFLDVVRQLCDTVGIAFPESPISPEAADRQRRLETRRSILQVLYRLTQTHLATDAGKAGREYLESRGFAQEACARLGIGLYPKTNYIKQYLREAGYSSDAVYDSACVQESMVGYLTFPWLDERGHPLTLYGTWPAREPPKGKPKKNALRNPGTRKDPLDHTKRSPYCLNLARQANERDLIVVEGLTDAALLQARGDTRVVAAVAADLSGEMVKTLARCRIKSATIALDPDQAGDNAIGRNVVHLRNAGIVPYVAPKLPDGLDPDELVLRDGLDGWKAHIKQKTHGFRHLAQAILGVEQRETGDDGWADRVIEQAVELVRDLELTPACEDELKRYFWSAIGKATGAEVKDLHRRLARQRTASTAAKGEDGKPAPFAVESLASIRPRPVRWLVPRYLPLGKVILLAGDGGHGKSTLTLHIAAALSQGKPALGLDYPEPIAGDTLLVQCEDDWADTVVPRLIACGASLDCIHRIMPSAEDGKATSFALAFWPSLEQTLQNNPAIRLVIIDPAGAYVGSGVDDHKDSELRSLLGPLAELAARCEVAILLVKHFCKAPTTKAVAKISGSTGYVNSVRAAYVLLPDESNQDRALFLPVKFNVGRKPKGLAYERVSLSPEEADNLLAPFDELTAEDRQRVSETLFWLDWKGEVDQTADGALGEAGRTRRANRVEECKAWLKELLKELAYPSDEIVEAAKRAGFAFDNVKEAKAALKEEGLRNKKLGKDWWSGFGPPGEWKKRPDPEGLEGLEEPDQADVAVFPERNGSIFTLYDGDSSEEGPYGRGREHE